jgi:hypothetical protein
LLKPSASNRGQCNAGSRPSKRAGSSSAKNAEFPRRGGKTNIYHFDGLIAAAKPYAEEKIEEQKAKAAIRDARAKRKGKPKLTLVTGDDE